MRRKLLVAIFFVMIINLFNINTAFGETSILKNGGFEDHLAGMIPAQWSSNDWTNDVKSIYKITSTMDYEGKYVLEIKSDVPNDAKMIQTVKIEPDTYYRFSGYIATMGIPKENAGATLSIMGYYDRTSPLIGSNNWTYREIYFKTYSTQSEVKLAARLGMWGSLTVGTAYFDDLKLEKISNPPSNIAILSPLQEQKKIVSNHMPSKNDKSNIFQEKMPIVIFISVLIILAVIIAIKKLYKEKTGEEIKDVEEKQIIKRRYPAKQRNHISSMVYPLKKLFLRIYELFGDVDQDEHKKKSERSILEIGRFNVDLRYILLGLIMILGIIARLYNIGKLPPGLNQDEASIGYDAFAEMNYGIDRNGMHFPVHFIAWGSGQNALYAYFIIPIIKLFGLSAGTVRMGSALLQIVSILVLFLTAKAIANWETGLLSAFLLAISPWGIISSRSGVENNIFPPLVLIAVYLFVLSIKKRKYLYWSFGILALCLYSYGTAYFFIPIFIFCTALYYLRFYRKREKEYIGIFLKAMLIFALISIPIIAFIYINFSKSFNQSINLPFFSIPKLTTTGRRYSQFVLLNSSVPDWSGRMQLLLANYRYLYDVVVKQVGGPFFVAGNFGLLYPNISNGFLCIGFVATVIESIKSFRNRMIDFKAVFIIWFFASVLLGVLFETNPGRSNIIFLPMILMIAYGIYKTCCFVTSICALCLKKHRAVVYSKSKLLIYTIILALFMNGLISFSNYYCNQFSSYIGYYYGQSFEDAIHYATAINTDNKSINIYDFNNTYIYVLFYTKYNPNEFVRTVKYDDPNGDFRNVLSFGNYKFFKNDLLLTPAMNSIYIIQNDKVKIPLTRPKNKKVFEHFTVLEY